MIIGNVNVHEIRLLRIDQVICVSYYREWMSNLIQLTASELPVPKPKKAKA
jgi:hypothetical protein